MLSQVLHQTVPLPDTTLTEMLAAAPSIAPVAPAQPPLPPLRFQAPEPAMAVAHQPDAPIVAAGGEPTMLLSKFRNQMPAYRGHLYHFRQQQEDCVKMWRWECKSGNGTTSIL